jgi:UDP-N-acetylglucosamine 2-epimerase (non-hydrolysing)
MKIMAVFGTRPEAIKILPLVKALKADPRFDCQVAVTAQHREMLDQVMDLFDVTADYDLDMMQAGQTLFDITARALTGLKPVLEEAKPDLALVHGDTSTTFAGALAAYYLQIPVGHVEAGLRSGNRYSPFPEEMNRRLTGNLANLHFAPTVKAQKNLLREGRPPRTVYVTGNTVIDALLEVIAKPCCFTDWRLADLDFHKYRVITVTTHRRENLGSPMRGIYRALRRLLDEFPDTVAVFPMHKNPAVRTVAHSVLDGHERIILTEPMDYLPFAHLLKQSHLIITDSGGLQEEAPALGKPVLVLRDTTERPEAIEAGTVWLTGTKEEDIYQQGRLLLSDSRIYDSMAQAVNPYGDGQACRRIIEAIAHWRGWTEERPAPFDVMS